MTDTATASPRPWRVDGAFILDSAGGAIAMMCEPDYTVDAALIVEAVNNYDEKKAKAEGKKRNQDTEDEWDPTSLKSYRRPWSVSIDDENCRAVIRDADGLEVAYISDVIRSRAGDTAQMFVGLVKERDRLCKNIASMMRVVYAERQKAEMFKRQWEKATGSEFAKKLSTARSERDRLRDIVRRLCDELESHYYEPQSMDDPSIVREAREAIGKGTGK